MIKLINFKKGSSGEDEKKSSDSSSDYPEKKKITVAQIVMNKHISELELPPNVTFYLPDPDDKTRLELIIKPDEDTFWYGGTYTFSVTAPEDYPHNPPKVICNTKVMNLSILDSSSLYICSL